MGGILKETFRSLRGHPGTTALAVISLAFGIGASLAVFGLVDAVLFRPLSVREPERLVRIFGTPERGGTETGRTSAVVFEDYRTSLRGLSGLALFREGVMVHLATGAGKPRPADATLVSGGYFETLGVGALVGRAIQHSDDEREGAHPVVMLSHGLWSREFGADPGAVGRTLRLNGHSFSVVGVTPPAFFGVGLEHPADLYVTVAMAGHAEPVTRGQLGFASSAFFEVVGRLAPGVSLEQARAEAELVAARHGAGQPGTAWPETDDPEWRRAWPHLRPATEAVALGSMDLARLMVVAVALVLLLACADAAGVLLARGERRRHDLAVRVALGARRARILREAALEGLVVATVATAAGLIVALAVSRTLVAAAPENLALPLAAATDLFSPRGIVAAVVLATLTGVVTSSAPALRASQADPLEALKAGAARLPSGSVPLRSVLVVGQVAAAIVLVSGAALLIRSLARAAALPSGFEAERVLVGSLNLARGGYDPPRAQAFLERLREGLQVIPGVEAAALGTSLPLQSGQATTVRAADRPVWVAVIQVSPGYVEALRLPLLRGRSLSRADAAHAPPVGLVNRELAETLWPGQDPINQRLDDFTPRGASVSIVGVVEVRAGGPRESARPLLLVPQAQFYDAFPWQPRTMVLVRSKDDPLALRPAVERLIASLDPDLPLLGVRTAEQELGLRFAQERLLSRAFALLGGIALLLSGTGLFGVVAFSTEARRREIGVRVALGARPGQVIRLVLGQSGRLVAIGLLLGIPATWALSKGLRAFLIDLAPTDPFAVGSAAGLLGLTGLLAAWAPARGALAIDPQEALRAE